MPVRLKDTTLNEVAGLSITTDIAAVIAATISSSEVPDTTAGCTAGAGAADAVFAEAFSAFSPFLRLFGRS